MNHSMRLAIFNEFVPLKLLSVADNTVCNNYNNVKKAQAYQLWSAINGDE